MIVVNKFTARCYQAIIADSNRPGDVEFAACAYKHIIAYVYGYARRIRAIMFKIHLLFYGAIFANAYFVRPVNTTFLREV